MARKLRVGVDPQEIIQEDWIWGNHRGGGGAPLKDHSGNTITDIKTIVKGQGML